MKRRASICVGVMAMSLSLLLTLPAPAQQKDQPSKSDQAASERGELLRTADGKVTISIQRDHQLTGDTKITLNGEPASLDDLQPGDMVTVKMGNKNEVLAINATRSSTPRRATDQQTVLGVTLAPSSGAGVLITEVEPASPAARAGIRDGDYILSIDGKQVSSPRELSSTIRQMQPGDRVQIVKWRGGQERTVSATLAAQRTAAFRGGFGEATQEQMILEEQRRLGKQNERLEDLIQQLRQDVRQLRDEVQRSKAKPPPPADVPAATKKEQEGKN